MPDSKADNAAGATPPSNATISTPMKNNALSPPMPMNRSSQATVMAQITEGTTSAASHDAICRSRGRPATTRKARLAAGWVTM